MKKIILIITILFLVGCTNETYESLNVGSSTNFLTLEDKDTLKEIFINHELSNIDLFFNYVDEYNKLPDNDCGMKSWDKIETFKYNEGKCYDRFDQMYSENDGNCRLTSFMLINDKLTVQKTKNDSGNYLMFDIDVIENNKNYEIVKNDYDKFITLFDEMDVSNVNIDDYKNVFINKWNEYGISINSDKFSLITVVMNDSYENVLFVGHAGILIPLKNKYLFIEKIAFEMPYQFSILENKEDLVLLFQNRANYFDDESKSGPFIYENNKLFYLFF